VITTDPGKIDSTLDSLKQMVAGELREWGVEPVEVASMVDIRYIGQSHELTVEYQPGDGWAVLSDRFHRLHAERNGFSRSQDAVEAVTVRATALGTPALTWSELPGIHPEGDPARGTRPIMTGGKLVDARVWWRPSLAPGTELVGPAVIEEPEATTFLAAGERASVHESGVLEVEW
jgi:N-methylhydantoinase A/oxoprolinase/acetone carboxylase beta subunit